MCSLSASTLLRALDLSEELATIPGLTTTLIKNPLPRSTATNKGHMQHHRANAAFTRNMQADIIAACAEVDCMFPPQEACAMQDMFCFVALADAITGTIYRLVWATKVALAAICLVFPALVLGYKSINVSMYHVPVPT
jgi:hypothetical protein